MLRRGNQARDAIASVRRRSCGIFFLLSMLLVVLIGTGCGARFEPYRTTLDVPDDLQRVQVSFAKNINSRLQYTSEEALLFFSQCDGIELETVPPAEVRDNQAAGTYTYQVDFYGSESSITYEFSLPYIKLPNGDWSIVVDEEIEYDLSNTIISLPADDPPGATIYTKTYDW